MFIPPKTTEIDEFKNSFGEKEIKIDVDTPPVGRCEHKEENEHNINLNKEIHVCKTLTVGFICGFCFTLLLLLLYINISVK